MSLRFASEQLADLRRDARLLIERAGDQEDQLEACVAATERDMRRAEAPVSHAAVALHVLDDEDLASHSPARVLITASTQQGVEMLARRVHAGGPRSQSPFVHVCGGGLSVEPEVVKEYFTRVLTTAAGGSILISAVEEMAPAVQDALMELLAGFEFAPTPSATVRLISGTTVSLLDRVNAGTFSDRLFYRLNVIHLMSGDRPHGSPTLSFPR
jgi:DNA-binding NtrC family response regulator